MARPLRGGATQAAAGRASRPKTEVALPLISHHALAGVARRDVGELVIEDRGSVDDEARARQRPEGGCDRAVRIEVMLPQTTPGIGPP